MKTDIVFINTQTNILSEEHLTDRKKKRRHFLFKNTNSNDREKELKFAASQNFLQPPAEASNQQQPQQSESSANKQWSNLQFFFKVFRLDFDDGDDSADDMRSVNSNSTFEAPQLSRKSNKNNF